MGYIVEQSDLTGVFEDYPIEIIQLLIKRVEEQGNDGEKALKIIRDKKIYADRNNGGLDWDDTPERYDFWCDVLSISKPLEDRIQIFYERYPKPAYPRIMEVSDYEDFRDHCKRVVIAKHNNVFIAWFDATTFEEAESKIGTKSWRYARELNSTIELTIEEIAKKLNIDASRLRIKK